MLLSYKSTDAVLTLSTARQSKLVHFSMQLSTAKNHYNIANHEYQA